MDLIQAKVYHDGSHFVAIRHTSKPKSPARVSTINEETKAKKEEFEKLYKENSSLSKKERQSKIYEGMSSSFDSHKTASEFVKQNLERKKRNNIVRKVRLMRKVRLIKWDYFVTLTYDAEKHTEESFKKSLKNCLNHYSSRKGWKYIGVWERSPDK